MTAAALLSVLPSLCAQNKSESFTVGNVTFKMIVISSNRSFKMGATIEQREEAMPDEFPEHSVNLSEFALGETEVTQGLWRAVMGDNPSLFQVKGPGGEELPVERVSYDDCLRFISKLNSLTGKQFRLPTEAEWECAARGGTNALYAGSGAPSVAWYVENSQSRPHKVRENGWGSEFAQISGLYNLSGNVAEWCSDWKGPYSEATQSNPKGPSSGTERICRGGGWSDVAWRCRTSSRSSHAPSYKASDLGFRLAMSMTPTVAFYRNPIVHGEKKAGTLELVSVELTEKSTVLSCSWLGGNSGSNCYLDRAAFLRDRATGKTYPITDVQGITFGPEKTYVGDRRFYFSLIFPPIPKGATAIDFIENSSSTWNMTDIELK